MRYVVERPAKWANELTLRIAGFVFLFCGLCAMQQRCHIRIFLLYDVVPRWLQRYFDTFWALLIVLFTFFLVYGSYKQVFVGKFYRWEMFGTAFDPPIPATIQPMVLIVISLIAIQTLLDLVGDGHAEPVVHTAADAIDQEELGQIRASVGDEGGEPITLGMSYHSAWLAGAVALVIVLAFFVFGRERSRLGWTHGKGLVPPFTVIGVVPGSIYGGITGITEAAGMGVLAVFIIALFRGEASIGLIRDSVMRSLRSTGTILWVTVGAASPAGAKTLAGGPTYIAKLIVGSEMRTMLVLLTMMLVLLFMGAFMDWVGIVLLIIPVFLPIVRELPVEEIGLIGQLERRYVANWFGVLFTMNMQVSFLSPPFGPAGVYQKSVPPSHISPTNIFKGFLPFLAVQLLALTAMLVWPPIVTPLLNLGGAWWHMSSRQTRAGAGPTVRRCAETHWAETGT